MNKQKPPKGIEWTRIQVVKNGERITLPGYTWNPTGGCLHGCTWEMPDGSIAECYAKTVAERLAVAAYPDGFETHYWRPLTLDEPRRLTQSAGIFVGSMADLFGHWTPRHQIQAVIDVMRDCDHHIFQTLSKYPVRLADFMYPSNAWIGVSLPAGHKMSHTGGARALRKYLELMVSVKASVRFMSIEPLWFDAGAVFEEWLRKYCTLPFEWVIIGAASNGATTYQPDGVWVQRLLDIMDGLGIPVFFKGNLQWGEHRADFPEYTHSQRVQKRMF